MQFKRVFSAIAAAFIATFAGAASISLEEAKIAAEAWARNTANLQGEEIGSSVLDARAVPGPDGDTAFYVVRMSGGGALAVSAETRIRPVVAFTPSDDIFEDGENALWTILNRDIPGRMKALAARDLKRGNAVAAPMTDEEIEWASLLSGDSVKRAGTGVKVVSDTRVEPLLKSAWGQGRAKGGLCFNYYTPNNYVCGCVATAASQVMYVHRYPTAYIPATKFDCYVDDEPCKLSTIAGTFDWGNMVGYPAKATTLTDIQRRAIGMLTYNVGVACEMMYTESGSGSFTANVAKSLEGIFGYASAKYADVYRSNMTTVMDGILPSLDYGLPVVVGVTQHEIVADGYGFNGNSLYVHMDMGWNGICNAWYSLPSFTTDDDDFFVLEEIVYNIMPETTGELFSGRVIDRKGDPVSGATVTVLDSDGNEIETKQSNKKGMYAFLVPSSASYTVKAVSGVKEGVRTVAVGRSVSDYDIGDKWGIDITVRGDIGNHTVTFDANGGVGTMEPLVFIEDDAQALTANAYTRDGYTFNGWSDTPDGEVVYSDGEIVSFVVDTTLYAVWGIDTYTVSYRCGSFGAGDSVNDVKTYGVDLEIRGALFYRNCYDQTGWAREDGGELAYEFGAMYSENANVTLYPVWTPNPENTCYVTFDANGGEGTMDPQEFVGDEERPLSANKFERTGFIFLGWSETPDGSVALLNGALISLNKSVTLYAIWKPTTFKVTYQRGRKGIGYVKFVAYKEYGTPLVLKDAVFTRTGYTQTGWATEDGGESVYELGGSYEDEAEVSLFPAWTRNATPDPGPGGGDDDPSGGGDNPSPGPAPGPTPGPGGGDSPSGGGDNPSGGDTVKYELYESVTDSAPSSQSEYNGYLFDDANIVAGTIKVKVGKPNAKTSLSTVKASVILADGKKISLKAASGGKARIASDGPTAVVFGGDDECAVQLGAYALFGKFGEFDIRGARNFFTSKNKSEKSAAAEIIGPWTGSMNVVGEFGALSVKTTTNGKAKVSGVLADGTKEIYSGLALIGDKWMCVPVASTKTGLQYILWLPRMSGGRAAVVGLGDGVVAGKAGELRSGAMFRIDTEDEIWSGLPGKVIDEVLPDRVSVRQNGKKWIVPQAGKVVYIPGKTTVDRDQTLDNPSGLKLTYKSGSGTFSGSFMVYYDVDGAIKKIRTTVSGVLVGDRGYGTATVKRIGTIPIVIE